MRSSIRLAWLLLASQLAPGAAQAFTGVVLWQQAGELPQVATAGHRDPVLARGTLTGDTPLHIGSITKLFTAVLVLREVQAERLTLDAPLGRWLPELPEPARAITLQQLLQHRSGLPEWQAESREGDGGRSEPVAAIPTAALARQVLARASEPPRAAAGGEFFYNNLDYLLLALVLERATGQPYAARLDAHILKPLRLRNTGLATTPAAGLRPAPAAAWQDGRWQRAKPAALSNYGAAGALVSTANDLARFGHALLAGELLARPWRERLFAEGLSVWSYPFPDPQRGAGVTTVERQGAVGHYRSTLMLLPERRAVLIVLANGDDEDFSTWTPGSFTHRLLSALLAGDPAGLALAAAQSP
jgi:D-alanyl-D-alanine carboxypeptidase